jgi:mono/diheme cytochrome c family protein
MASSRVLGRRQPRRLRVSAGLAWVSALSVVLSACSLAEDITPPPGALPPAALTSPAMVSPVPSEAGPPQAIDLNRGASLYSDHCAPCHGPSGKGDGPLAAQFSSPVPALADPQVSRLASPSQWFALVTNGDLQQFMPPFRGVLTAEERWDVTYYALALGSSSLNLTEASSIYAQQCASCHGSEGKGDGTRAASLAGPLPDLTLAPTLAEATGQELYNLISQGSPRGMPPAPPDLTEKERWGLVAYVRSLAEGTSGPIASGPGPSGPPAAPGPSAVERVGQVTNGTTHQGLPDQTVTVQTYLGTTLSGQQTTVTDGQGNFKLLGAPLSASQSVVALVTYLGVTYSSGLQQGPSGSASISLPLTVYDTTTDASFLSMDREHVFVESLPDQGMLRVGVLAIFSNPGQRTVVASQAGGEILAFDLPRGARNLQFEGGTFGARYRSTSSGFTDTQPVLPGSGSHQVLYSFDLPARRTTTLSFPVRYPMAGEVVVVPQTLKVQSEQVVDSGSQQIQGAAYELYAGGALSPGQTLDLTVRDTSQSTVRFGSPASLPILVGAGALACALLGAAVYGWRRQRFRAGALASAPHDREGLLRSIAALDDAYEAGELEEEAYRNRRQELKARLLDQIAAEEP